MAIKGLTEGRMVHYVLPDGKNKGIHRPAIVVHVWNRGEGSGSCNLTVFPDGSNDYTIWETDWTINPVHLPSGLLWATSVPHSDDHEPGTWHFIEFQE